MGLNWSSEEERQIVPYIEVKDKDIILDLTHIIRVFTDNVNLVQDELYEIPTDIMVGLGHTIAFESYCLGEILIDCGGKFIFLRGCFWSVEFEGYAILLKMKRSYFVLEGDINNVLVRIKKKRQ